MPRLIQTVTAAVLGIARCQTDTDLIAALCRADSSSPSDYAATSYAPSVTQPAPLSLTLATAESGASAFWLHDDEGELIAFTTDTASGAVTFDISSTQPSSVTAFVHYGEPLCRVAESPMTYTYDGEIDRYFREGLDNYGESTWPAALVRASTPRVVVDYEARSATVSVDLVAGHEVPFVYVRGQSNQLLAFGRPAPTASAHNATFTLAVHALPAFGTAVFGCAPLGGKAVCTEVELTATITAQLRQAHPVSATPLAPVPAALSSQYALQITRPEDDEACDAAAAEYVLWAEHAGSVVGFSHGSSLAVAVGPAADCAYRSTECLVTVYVLCADSLRAGVLNVSALAEPAVWEGSEPTGDATATPPRCEDLHPGRDTSWVDEESGERCECFNGVAECGPPPLDDTHIVFNSLEAALLAGAGAVIVLVALTFCCYLRMRHSKAMETPIEGATRRSLVMPGKNDYVKSSSKASRRGEELELPAPPGARVELEDPPPPPPGPEPEPALNKDDSL